MDVDLRLLVNRLRRRHKKSFWHTRTPVTSPHQRLIRLPVRRRHYLLEVGNAPIENVADMNNGPTSGLPNLTKVEAETLGTTDRDCASSWPDGFDGHFEVRPQTSQPVTGAAQSRIHILPWPIAYWVSAACRSMGTQYATAPAGDDLSLVTVIFKDIFYYVPASGSSVLLQARSGEGFLKKLPEQHEQHVAQRGEFRCHYDANDSLENTLWSSRLELSLISSKETSCLLPKQAKVRKVIILGGVPKLQHATLAGPAAFCQFSNRLTNRWACAQTQSLYPYPYLARLLIRTKYGYILVEAQGLGPPSGPEDRTAERGIWLVPFPPFPTRPMNSTLLRTDTDLWSSYGVPSQFLSQIFAQRQYHHIERPEGTAQHAGRLARVQAQARQKLSSRTMGQLPLGTLLLIRPTSMGWQPLGRFRSGPVNAVNITKPRPGLPAWVPDWRACQGKKAGPLMKDSGQARCHCAWSRSASQE
ncbi:hypothetical protein BDP55DRAFT_736702 [Colletotrichum godetiae]|uniref:Uncharacterized protein n=1 Tax=Colletotrichum godetiae TaxID=1209918 RepID=A0AAJ0F0R4_9PEZI|nr:uncharacterized protein BDP55DRAFT_736702 [Colletotrichum godetiae]KAK1701490.1 hypothetical protein BDP55DRAFT_736702 [Colletotrichum godetiae]